MVAAPQIRQFSFAKDWHVVSHWGVAHGQGALQFAGTASASTLCPINTAVPSSGACYDPQAAWQVFFHELAAEFQAGVAQLADGATDIQCSNGSTVQSCK